MKLHPDTCRAARALLDWTQDELAGAAGLCRSTIRDFEKGRHALQPSTEVAIVGALAIAGVEITRDERGRGVRRRE